MLSIDFKVKVKVESRLFSVESILYFKLIWIDDRDVDNNRIDNCSVKEHNLYNGRWN